MSKPLLIISGPTATGKTALAVKLAKKYHGELVSADSRQIYKDLNIGVGKDHPANTPIHLVDIISPRQTFSAGQYRLLALKAIADIHSRGKLPILVGCTGFYVDAVTNPRPTFDIKPNFFLRRILNRLPTSFLQKIYRFLDNQSYLSLNNSDKNNPRRLVRKIEIKLSSNSDHIDAKPDYNILHLSLAASNPYLYQRIDTRVDQRIKDGQIDEVKNLLKKYSWSDPGLKVSAYSSLQPYIEKKSDLESCLQVWKYAEHRDARHQKTWFSKHSNSVLLDISKPNFAQKTKLIVDKWYNKL